MNPVVASLSVSALVLGGGLLVGTLSGLYVVTAAFILGSAVQVLWLALGSRGALRALRSQAGERARLEPAVTAAD